MTKHQPAAPSAKTPAAKPASTRNCGECLMNDVEIVALDQAGICPRCGANYGAAN